MLYSRGPRKLFPLEGLYQLSGTSTLSRQSVILRKYGKDFLFCFSNYPFLLSVSYFLALNIVHQRSSPSVFSLQVICESVSQCDAEKMPSFCSPHQNVWNKFHLLIPNLKSKVKQTGIQDYSNGVFLFLIYGQSKAPYIGKRTPLVGCMLWFITC